MAFLFNRVGYFCWETVVDGWQADMLMEISPVLRMDPEIQRGSGVFQ